jgi:hypothetical protein
VKGAAAPSHLPAFSNSLSLSFRLFWFFFRFLTPLCALCVKLFPSPFFQKKKKKKLSFVSFFFHLFLSLSFSSSPPPSHALFLSLLILFLIWFLCTQKTKTRYKREKSGKRKTHKKELGKEKKKNATLSLFFSLSLVSLSPSLLFFLSLFSLKRFKNEPERDEWYGGKNQ